jgi:hypothetical protein
MNRSHGVVSAALLLALSSAACAGHHGAPGPVAVSAAVDSCATPLPDAPRDTLIVALAEPVNPAHAPVPANNAERLVFRQLHDAPGSFSCSGVQRASSVYQLTESAGRLFATPAWDSLSGYPVLEFRAATGTDARDLMDAGADLIVTRDPATLAYAERRSDFITFPLAWDRTYLLLSPKPLAVTGAADAVRSEARPAAVCAENQSAVTSPSASGRIGYPAGDPAARELAERISALEPGLMPTALGPGGLTVAIQSARDPAYIVSLPRTGDPCGVAFGLRPSGWALTPLVETRARLIMRRGVARVSVDRDGLFRVMSNRAP